MANGYFERGEMYDVLIGSDLPGELTSHRPGIIVSADIGNRSSPTVVLILTTTTTTTNRRIGVNHLFTINGIDNCALANQFMVVNKNRLKRFYGKLSDSDMREIDKCIEKALDLGHIDDAPVKEKEKEIAVLNLKMEEERKKIAELNAKIAAHEDECTSLKVEIEMWKRLYEKALDQVCSMKLSGDVARRTEGKIPVVTMSPKVEEPEKEKSSLVDINSASFGELKSCGFTDSVILQIIQKRPHEKVEDLQNLNGLTSMGYQILSKKVCCVVPQKEVERVVLPKEQPSAKKVNVNEMGSAQQLKNLTGMSLRCAGALVAHRKKNGDFKSLEELTSVDGFGKTAMNRYGHLLEV